MALSQTFQLTNVAEKLLICGLLLNPGMTIPGYGHVLCLVREVIDVGTECGSKRLGRRIVILKQRTIDHEQKIE